VTIVIDMNLSPDWEHVFAEYCDIEHWSRIGDSDTPDALILEWAKKRGHIILTNDLDFGAILAATHLDSPSVFQIRSMCLDPLVIGAEVLACFKKFEQDLKEGALISYDLRKARVRRLPLA
jgi:predicted nuclease of predicted toxin-antitoxin system